VRYLLLLLLISTAVMLFSDTENENQWDQPDHASANHGMNAGYGRVRRSFGTVPDTAQPGRSFDRSSPAYDQFSLVRPSIRTYNYNDSTITDRYGIRKSGVGASPLTLQTWNQKTLLMSSENNSAAQADISSSNGFDEAHRSWQLISRIIVLLVLCLVVVVIVSYCFITRSSQLPVDTRSNYLLCSGDVQRDASLSPKCTSQSDISVVQKMIRELLDALSTRAGEYDCRYRSDARSMHRSEIIQLLNDRVLITADKKAADDYLSLIADMCLQNDHWDVQVYGNSKDKDFALESVRGRKSIWCRITDSARYIFSIIVLILLIIATGCGLFVLIRLRRSAADAEHREVLDLVEKIIDILRHNAAAASAETAAGRQPVPLYLAIPHVRDALIPLHLRQAKQRVWDKAVKFLSEHESRVRVEQQDVAGEG